MTELEPNSARDFLEFFLECYIQCNKFFFWRIPNDKFFPRFSIQILNIWKNELWSSGVWLYLHFLILACRLFILCFIQSLILTDTKMFSIKSLFFSRISNFLSKKLSFGFRLDYGYIIIICVLLFSMKVINFRLTKTLRQSFPMIIFCCI